MPPLGEKLIEVPQPTAEELAQKAEIRGIGQELYGVMQAIISIPERQHLKFLPFATFWPASKSAVAEYPLPGEPEFRKMHAWVRREPAFEIHDVILNTQVVEKVNGQTIRRKSSFKRAWTHDGNFHWANDTSRNLTHEEKLVALGNIGDTLALIAQAQIESRAQ